jgi:hypothetical protein
VLAINDELSLEIAQSNCTMMFFLDIKCTVLFF